MNTTPRSARRRRGRWLIIALGALALMGLALLILFAQTPQGDTLLNVAEYRLRIAWWSLIGGPEYDPARTGSLSGVIHASDGQPLADAIALVAFIPIITATGGNRDTWRLGVNK